MHNHFLNRINNLRNILSLRHSDCFYTSKNEDVYYLTGFNSSNGNLFITKTSAIIITDKRYTQQLKNIPDFIEVKFIETNLIDAFKDLVHDLKIKKMFLEPSKITFARYLELRKVRSLYWKNLKEELNYFFAYQDDFSIQKTKRAVKLTEKIFRELINEIKEGVTEIDLQAELKYKLSKVPNGKITFEPIVLFGKNSAYPHGISSNYKLKLNSSVLIDFGLSIEGLTSDFTRTIFFGKPDKSFLKKYSIVKEALQIAIENLKLNLKAQDLYFKVVEFFSRYGLEKYFTHGLGHGLGIYLHNYPHLSKNSNDLIKENLVIAIEPALYFENKYGIRIEQNVLITKNGLEVLTKTTDELIVL